ncbi:MAG: thioredoxin [Acidobacteria bacterium]|nr:MAG: thioredoxin [Acidobacteriota bacterium]
MAGLLAATSAFAQPPKADPNEFVEIGGYVLSRDGKPVPDVRFFRSAAAGSVLVAAAPIEGVVELVPRGRSMRIYPSSDFVPGDEGIWNRKPSAQPTKSGDFEIVGQLPRFQHDGAAYSMSIKPPLLGPTTQKDIVAYDPTWGTRAKLYEPFAQHLNPLFQVEEPVVVKVFFGSWCNHCQDMVPKIFKLEQQLVGTPIRFEYHGLPLDIQKDELAKQFEISGQLPFGVIYVDGEEKQRVQGLSWRFPDMALNQALAVARSAD